jgi:hypothetical protein
VCVKILRKTASELANLAAGGILLLEKAAVVLLVATISSSSSVNGKRQQCRCQTRIRNE